MKLSEHFTFAELTVTATGLTNTPSPNQLIRLSNLAYNLEVVRTALGGLPIEISSGFRSPEVNAAAGGARTSAHLDGDAADITVQGKSNADIITAIVGAKIPFDQLIDENKNGSKWVHVSFAKALRGETLAFNGTNYVRTYLKG
jgi:zinc D-Ala-D-Ala carboxypeptidase